MVIAWRSQPPLETARPPKVWITGEIITIAVPQDDVSADVLLQCKAWTRSLCGESTTSLCLYHQSPPTAVLVRAIELPHAPLRSQCQAPFTPQPPLLFLNKPLLLAVVALGFGHKRKTEA